MRRTMEQMSNLQIYTWIGVPALTVLIGIKNLLEFRQWKAIIARLDRMNAGFEKADLQVEKPLGKTTELDIR